MALTAQQVQQFYIGYYGRPADPVGLTFWQTQTEAQALTGFAGSAEFTNQFTGLSTSQQVTKVYGNLLGRTPDVAGLLYWSGEITAGRETIGSLVLSMIKNALGKDVTTIADRVTYSTAFTAALNTTEEVNAYSGAAATQTARDALLKVTAAAVGDHTALTAETAKIDATIAAIVAGGSTNPGQTFTLTTGADNITGTSGNDTVSGVSSATAGESTLNLADVVDGGAGTDTLKLIVSGAVNMAATEIKNVEKFEIKDLTGGNSHSFANVTGEAEVLVVGSTGATTVTNLDKTAVGVKDITGAAAIQTFTFKDAAFASTSKLDVVVSNAGNKVTGAAQTITIGTASPGAGAADGVNIAATGSNNIILSGTAGNNIGSAAGIKTLTVTGSGSVTVGATSSLAAAAGAGASSLASNLTTVDASANTGGVTISLNKTTVKVTGGSGADKITVDGAMTSGAQFNLGAGDDQLLKGAGSLDANVVVDAGAGTDIIDNGLITVANGGVFKNFEKIGLSTAGTTDIDLLTGSTITGLVVNTADVVGVTVQNVATNSTIEVTAADASQTGTLTAAVKGAAASTTDVMNISFNGAAQAATPAAYNIAGGTMTLANVETINVASGGADNTWNQLALTADKVKAINITGAKNLDLTFAGVNGTNPVAGQGGAVSSIDGSAATGKLNINLANVTYDDKVGITVKGGTGNDTITTNASSATLTGTGGNDKYVVTATVAASAVDATTAATKMTTITDFNAGDMLDFTGFAAAAGLTSLTKAQTDIATATNLTNAINLALENAAVNAAGKAAWFQYGGNTYVVNQGAADTAGAANDFTAADAIVKLTGLVDLTNATVAANVLTLA